MDRIDAANSSEAMFLRIDMPGHIRHSGADTFEKVYLSYHGEIPAGEFLEDFAPDEKFHHSRAANGVPERMIRAYKLRDPATGKSGPWLAGMTLDPAVVHEAWCHQRGYVCLIEDRGDGANLRRAQGAHRPRSDSGRMASVAVRIRIGALRNSFLPRQLRVSHCCI
jgi:hypothetical protein